MPTIARLNHVDLRPYQEQGVESIRVAIRAGIRRILVVAATGSGKTVLFAHILCSAISKGKRVLVLAHRRELIQQTVDKLLSAGVDPMQIGVIMGDTRQRPDAAIQVASVDTLRNRARPKADIIVVDEAHRGLAKTYVDIAADYPDAVHLGFTATPWRTDGKGLGHAYDELIVVARIPELVRDGYLVPTRCFSHPRKPDLSSVRVTAGDYNEADLAAVMDSGVLLGDLVEHYQTRGQGLPAFYFACNVEHSKHIVEVFSAAGIPAAHVDGNTPKDERAKAIADLRSGRIKVLSNCNVFTEGTDVPPVKIIGLVRPTKSRSLAFQMMGRGMRPSENGTHCIVLDHAGVVQTHGHPCEPQVYSLEDTKKKRSLKEEPATKTCPACGVEVPAQTRVCECGHEWEIERKEHVEVPGQLVEVQPKVRVPTILTAAEERAAYEKFLAEARAKSDVRVPELYARAIFAKRFGRQVNDAVVGSTATAAPPARIKNPMPDWLARQVGPKAAKEQSRAEQIAAEDSFERSAPDNEIPAFPEASGPRARIEL